MRIILNMNQWRHLKKIVTQGKAAERILSKPVEVTNNDVAIEIKDEEVTIILPD